MTKLQQMRREYWEKVNEVRKLIPVSDEDSEIKEFGYKTRDGDILYQITDFGNILKFFEKQLLEMEKLKDEAIRDIMFDSYAFGKYGDPNYELNFEITTQDAVDLKKFRKYIDEYIGSDELKSKYKLLDKSDE